MNDQDFDSSQPSTSTKSIDQLHPSAHTSESTLYQHQFELSDLVIVSTLDGKLHGLDRTTGKWNWTLNDPNLKTEGLINLSLVQSHHLPDPTQDHDELYAIEPHNDGDLYVFIRSPSSSKLQKLPLSVSQLVHLSPFTFPSDSSKMFVGKKDSHLIGIDLKNGQVVGVLKPDMLSKPLKGKGRDTCQIVDTLKDRETCLKEGNGQGSSSSKSEPDEASISDSIEQRPQDLLYVGRTDYQISIYSKPDTLIQTLRYSTYSPSNLGSSLQSLWTHTPDEMYLEPMHDGNLICFQVDRMADDPAQHHGGMIKWQNSFDYPVTSIFDVAFPKSDQGPGGSSDPHSSTTEPSRYPRGSARTSHHPTTSLEQPVMFVQPKLLPSKDDTSSPHTFSAVYEQFHPTKSTTSGQPKPLDPMASSSKAGPQPDFESAQSSKHQDKAFLGKFDTSFFIMSQNNYPLVSFAPSAHQALGNNNVIGMHSLVDPGLSGDMHTLGQSFNRHLLLEAGSRKSNGKQPDHMRSLQHPHLALDPAPHPPPEISSGDLRPRSENQHGTSSIFSLPSSTSPTTSHPTKHALQHRAARISSLIVRRFRNQLTPLAGGHGASELLDDTIMSMNPVLTIGLFALFLVWLASKKTRPSSFYRWDNRLRGSGSLSNSKEGMNSGTLLDYWLRGKQMEEPSDSLSTIKKATSMVEDEVIVQRADEKVKTASIASESISGSQTDVLHLSERAENPGLKTSEQAEEVSDEIENEDGDLTVEAACSTPQSKPKPKRRRGKRPGQKAAAAAAKAEAEAAMASKMDTNSPSSLLDTPRPLPSQTGSSPSSTPTLRFANTNEASPKPKFNLRKKKSPLNSSQETADLSDDGVSVVKPAKPQQLNMEQFSVEPITASFTAFASPVTTAFQPHKVGSLLITDETLGYGSHGTVVLKGTFQGRQVAIKRLLKDFVTLATQEVSLLQESDDHPNVVRYFVKESLDNFLYIALELCNGSLFDLIERRNFDGCEEITSAFNCKKALKQITSGLKYLHKLKIVHRDIKPQNILISIARSAPLSKSKRPGSQASQPGRTVRMLISDFGLCKKLDVDESSFAQTANHAAGSFGYRAPEILKGQVNLNEQSNLTPNSSITSSTINGSSGESNPSAAKHRLTRSIDIFSLGCIFYYVLTKGEHPFGSRYEREVNILKGEMSLEQLDGFDEEAFEAQQLIRSMLRSNPKERPTAEYVLQNPYFWDSAKRLTFLCDSSDRFEIMERDPPTLALEQLEDSTGFNLYISPAQRQEPLDWYKKVDRVLLDNLGKYRRYDSNSVRDLLRVMRNKKHHFQDLPDGVKRTLGSLPEGFLGYFTRRFPSLLSHVHLVVEENLAHEPMFGPYFEDSEDL